MRDINLILFNGKIISGDVRNNIYEAVAIRDDRIAALGTSDSMLALKNNRTRLFNLEGKVVIPGLIDTHSHTLGASLSEMRGELFVASSVDELLSHIREKVKQAGKGEWLYFPNTYPARLEEHRYPTMDELDAAAPDNPVYLDGAYAGQANSCALRIAGIDEKTAPCHGQILRDEKTGRISGRLFLCGDLIKRHLEKPRYEKHEALDAVQKLLKGYGKVGITSVIDACTTVEAVDIFNTLYQNGKLNIRLTYTFPAGSAESVIEESEKLIQSIGTPPEWGKTGFIKIFLDGGILTGTSYMRKPYKKGSGIVGTENDDFCGIILFSKEQIVEYIRKAFEAGLQMTAHCIGDAAADRFVSAYEEVNRSLPVNGRRFSVIHADFTDTRLLERIKNLGLVLISQPAWHYKDGSVLDKIFDRETMRSFLPYGDMEKLGVSVCAGSDHMVKHDSFLSQNPYNPFLGMYNLVTRKTRYGEVVYPEQKVSRQTALRMYTLYGAYASFDENRKGSLEVGKFADMAVIDRDLYICPEEEIPFIESELTLVGGKTIWKKG